MPSYLFPEGGYSHGPRHLVPLVPLLMLPLAVPGVTCRRARWRPARSSASLIAALAASVSFLEDQSPVAAAQRAARTTTRSIRRRDGPIHRYRTDYVPFKFALTSGHWMSPARPAGNGPDFFALHLLQARRTLPGGTAIPSWLPWAVSLPWMVILCGAALSLRRADGRFAVRHKAHKDTKTTKLAL